MPPTITSQSPSDSTRKISQSQNKLLKNKTHPSSDTASKALPQFKVSVASNPRRRKLGKLKIKHFFSTIKQRLWRNRVINFTGESEQSTEASNTNHLLNSLIRGRFNNNYFLRALSHFSSTSNHDLAHTENFSKAIDSLSDVELYTLVKRLNSEKIKALENELLQQPTSKDDRKSFDQTSNDASKNMTTNSKQQSSSQYRELLTNIESGMSINIREMRGIATRGLAMRGYKTPDAWRDQNQQHHPSRPSSKSTRQLQEFRASLRDHITGGGGDFPQHIQNSLQQALHQDISTAKPSKLRDGEEVPVTSQFLKDVTRMEIVIDGKPLLSQEEATTIAMSGNTELLKQKISTLVDYFGSEEKLLEASTILNQTPLVYALTFPVQLHTGMIDIPNQETEMEIVVYQQDKLGHRIDKNPENGTINIASFANTNITYLRTPSGDIHAANPQQSELNATLHYSLPVNEDNINLHPNDAGTTATETPLPKTTAVKSNATYKYCISMPRIGDVPS